ncbi:MAG TPA: type III pantothenate kinase [Nitrospiria bacterium]|nr:type III pantothenate kinase [Nitrospiria bacterium]
MLLAIDIGNTSIHFGVFAKDKLKGEWRITTTPHKTSDEYGMTIKEFLRIGRLDARKIEGAVLCSVVPILTPAFSEAAMKYFHCKPLVVSFETKTGLKILYDPPRDVGSDRIANAVAAHHRYGEAVIIVDFGTATTFDILSQKGEYVGGIITPGLMISAEALFARAAKLSEVELTRPKTLIGQDTVSSVQSGLIFGYTAMVDGMVERIRQEMGGRFRVVATGGLANIIVPQSKTIEETRPFLTLEGLNLLYQKNKDVIN